MWYIYISYTLTCFLFIASQLCLLSTCYSVAFADVGFPIYNLGNIVPSNDEQSVSDEQTLYIGRKELKRIERLQLL